MAGSSADRAASAADVAEENSISRQPRGRRPSSGQLKTLAALSSSLLPTFGAGIDIGYQPTLKKYVITPYDPRNRWWQLFLMVLVFYSAWASPFELAFPRAASGSLLAVDVFFGADIAFSFFVAYFNSSTFLLVDDRRKIAKRYLARPCFVMDVASTIPFQIIYRIVTGKRNGATVFGVVNLLRPWRLRRASNLSASLEKDVRFSYFWTRFVKLICVTLFAVHSAACIYYWMAIHHRLKENTWIGSQVPDFEHTSIWLGYSYALY